MTKAGTLSQGLAYDTQRYLRASAGQGFGAVTLEGIWDQFEA